MPNFKDGDRVRVISREQTEEDGKTQMYYPFYAGLVGTVQKAYDKGEVAVEIDQESLTKEIRKRHEDVRDQMKTKWLEGLSEEGRAKLTEREKDFNLRYVILVSVSDLEKAGPRAVKAAPQEPADVTNASTAGESVLMESTGRRTLAEIEAAEEAEFQRRAQKQ